MAKEKLIANLKARLEELNSYANKAAELEFEIDIRKDKHGKFHIYITEEV